MGWGGNGGFLTPFPPFPSSFAISIIDFPPSLLLFFFDELVLFVVLFGLSGDLSGCCGGRGS